MVVVVVTVTDIIYRHTIDFHISLHPAHLNSIIAVSFLGREVLVLAFSLQVPSLGWCNPVALTLDRGHNGTAGAVNHPHEEPENRERNRSLASLPSQPSPRAIS